MSKNIFGFGKEEDEVDNDQEELINIHENDENTHASDDNKTIDDTDLGFKCPKIDLYERLNFQKLKVRSKKRFQTEIGGPSKILQKENINNEITKIVEEIKVHGSKTDDHLVFNKDHHYFETKKSIDKSRGRKEKKTIKFSTQQVTFQYPKEMRFSQNQIQQMLGKGGEI